MSHHLDSPIARQDVRLDITELYCFRGNVGTVFIISVCHSIAGDIPVAPNVMFTIASNTPLRFGIGKESVTSKPSNAFPYVAAQKPVDQRPVVARARSVTK